MLDCAIGEKDPIKGNGGIPERTIVEVFGRNQSFKSGTTEHVAKSILEDDKKNKVLFIYTEEPDMDRFKSIGVDLNRVHTLGCYEDEETKLQMAERQLELAKRAVQDPYVKLVVIDSIKALCSAKQLYDKKGNIKELEDEEQMAVRAKLVGEFIRDFTQLNERAILLMTNQVSDRIGISYEVGPEFRVLTPGGRYKEYMAHLRIEQSTRPLYTEKEHPLTGKRLLLGWEVWYRLIKNKFSKKTGNRVAMSEFMFDPAGFRRGAEVLNCGEYLGIIQKSGNAIYIINEQKIRGYDNAVKFLESNLEVRLDVEKQIVLRSEELFQDKTANNSSEDLLA